ncbi:class I SAM-dependent methyltransferase [Nocardia neocaledoniensis]|uniref:class I SAM-dependent methyltransferase n=1 Tax=Nocardia neocaledoniensis TaxID=236511 RepID=UPI0024573396|nr:class I SAM-dependent methyltransferase [Nocardia neocaledoniensis]
MTTFDHATSLGYDRRATRLLGSLYRRIAADIDTATAPGARVADIGTGPGRLLSCLAARRPDLRLHGVDLSPHMIEIAHRNLAGHPVALAVADVGDLPYADASVDLAVSSLSMHEWPDLDAAARELRRVLAPGGALTVYDFRFARTTTARRALATHFGTVRTAAVRLPWHPLALVTRYHAAA